MTDVYGVYQSALDKANKEENSYFPVDLFNRLLQVASTFVFNDYQARLQSPATAVLEKQKLLDRLFTFIQRNDVGVENGYAKVPDDYAYFSNAKAYYDNGDSLIVLNALAAKLCEAEDDLTIDASQIEEQIAAVVNNPKMVGVQLLDNEQISRRLNSYIPGKRPSFKKPVMEREGKKFHIYPEGEPSLFLWYYRRPARANLIMRQVPATGDLQYDNQNSTQVEWDEESLPDIVSKVVQDYSIYIREKDLFAMSEKTKSP